MEYSAIIVYDINHLNNNNMSSLNQLISEIAHSIQQADNVPVRRAIREGIIHARNELIRHSFANHNYTDKVLKQKFKLTLIEIDDNGLKEESSGNNIKIKVTANKVPRPVRLDNNLPFHSVKTPGYTNNIIIPFVGEGATRFYKHLPGMNCSPTYNYVNDYIYVIGLDKEIDAIVVESVFEYPHEITLNRENDTDVLANANDDDEFFLPEDLVNSVKKLVLETFNPEIVRNTNEVPIQNIAK